MIAEVLKVVLGRHAHSGPRAAQKFFWVLILSSRFQEDKYQKIQQLFNSFFLTLIFNFYNLRKFIFIVVMNQLLLPTKH
jgi:hypothetical protein